MPDGTNRSLQARLHKLAPAMSAAAALFIGSAQSARAQGGFGYETFSSTLTPQVLTPFAAGSGHTLSVTQYNPYTVDHTHGDLSQIVVTWSVTATQSYTYSISSGSGTIFTTTNTAIAALLAPGSTTQVLARPSVVSAPLTNTTIVKKTPITGVSTPTGTDVTTLPGTDARGYTWNNTTDFVPYIGSGNVTFEVAGGATNTMTNDSGNISETVTTYVGGTVTIVYQYKTVPEPQVWSFVLTGLFTGGYVFRNRRYKRSSKFN